jgi:hypothetical protein
MPVTNAKDSLLDSEAQSAFRFLKTIPYVQWGVKHYFCHHPSS